MQHLLHESGKNWKWNAFYTKNLLFESFMYTIYP